MNIRDFFIEPDTVSVGKKFLTIPNAITLAGIALIFVYVYCYTTEIYTSAIPLFVFAIGCSDMLDGYYARKRGEHTRIGKFLDPLRDKLFLFACLGNIIFIAGWSSLVIAVIAMEAHVIALDFLRRACAMRAKIHAIAKTRQMIMVLSVWLIVVQIYWTSIFVPIYALLNIIALMSAIGAAYWSFATWKYLSPLNR
ncbi:CDP-alcohol phosphatidyltransferase family protein [bacterium]|nr:CDP-alcohol phosphatidyltransferase family protein [bacterium]MCI0565735.1 CDP-alcohol phosphatidyltransferase family protein [bacterium]